MGTLRLPSGTGRAGEAAAAALLRRSGYKIIERNFRVREGEIDIVAEHSGDLVFVEVKARRSGAFGIPEESLTEAKKSKTRRCRAGIPGRQRTGTLRLANRPGSCRTGSNRPGRTRRCHQRRRDGRVSKKPDLNNCPKNLRPVTPSSPAAFPGLQIDEPGVRDSRCYTSVPDSTDPCSAAFIGTQKMTPA